MTRPRPPAWQTGLLLLVGTCYGKTGQMPGTGGLFGALYSLSGGNRQEDFFTEILAEVLRSDDRLATRFVDLLLERGHAAGSARFDGDRQSVMTQVSFGKSRIDLMLRSDSILVFCEHKLHATAGQDQLQRYYRVLSEERGARTGLLAYVTMRAALRDEGEVRQINRMAKLSEGGPVGFAHVLWEDVWQALRAESPGPRTAEEHNSHSLLSNCLRFMEEEGMAPFEGFVPEDYASAERFLSVSEKLSYLLEQIGEELRPLGFAMKTIQFRFLDGTLGMRVSDPTGTEALSVRFGVGVPRSGVDLRVKVYEKSVRDRAALERLGFRTSEEGSRGLERRIPLQELAPPTLPVGDQRAKIVGVVREAIEAGLGQK